MKAIYQALELYMSSFDFMSAMLKVSTCTPFLQCNDDVCTR